MEPFKIGFNKEYVKGLSKDKFIKEFKEVYPDHDLSGIYDKIVPPKEVKPKSGK